MKKSSNNNSKKKILIFVDYFLPGYKAGGPIKTIKNLVNELSSKFDIYIVTRNHDFGEETPYNNIESNKWNTQFNLKIMYLSKNKININGIKNILLETKYNLIYFNIFFSFYFSILPLLILLFINKQNYKILLAPRGEFSPGALRIKKIKKHLYIYLTKIIRLYHNVIFHATNEYELSHIRKYYRQNIIKIAPNISGNHESLLKRETKKLTGSINVVFLSRITEKKNLLFVIRILKKVTGNVNFNIYGPIDKDKEYWEKCLVEINKLPSNVKVTYHGPIENSNVQFLFSKNDLFFFPTFGENYGHVIWESLSAGCPVLISDQTPWTELEKFKAGWVYSLNKPHKFIEKINYLIQLDNYEYEKFYNGAQKYLSENLLYKEQIKKNIELFDT